MSIVGRNTTNGRNDPLTEEMTDLRNGGGSPVLRHTLFPEILTHHLTAQQKKNFAVRTEVYKGYRGNVLIPSGLTSQHLGYIVSFINHRTGENIIGTLDFISNSPQVISQRQFDERWETEVCLRSVPKLFTFNDQEWTVAVHRDM